MLQAPDRGRFASLLHSWRSRLAGLGKGEVMSGSLGTGALTWPVLIFFLIAVIVTAIQMWLAIDAAHQSPLLPEAVYLAGLVVVVYSRVSRPVWGIVAYALLAIALCILLDAMTHSDWGNIGLYAVLVTVVYRLPPRMSVPIAVFGAVVILVAEGLFDLMLGRGHVNGGGIVTQALIIGFAFAASLAQRTRRLLISRLERTQAQLRDEMGRAAELAAARERARIARDIHDVLAHSLTVLSVQAQALRQLVRDNPERAAAILDQMAEVLRESQVESRQIVGLLREAVTDEDAADAAARLRVAAERFAERTGVRCTLREHGSAIHLSTQHVEVLRFALQEALTNAYRHGRAAHAEAELCWERVAVRLTVRDDGSGSSSAAPAERSGHGLRGMRERAAALGGTVEAGPRADGSDGFEVTMTLPLGADQTATVSASMAGRLAEAEHARSIEGTGKVGERTV